MVMPKKDTKEKPKEPELHSYTIKLEVLVPAVITYNLLAESPEEALEKIKLKNVMDSNDKKISWNQIKKLSAKVNVGGRLLTLLTKKY